MTLPTKPSDDLPEEAREWVSRFIPSSPAPAPAPAEPPAPRAARPRAKAAPEAVPEPPASAPEPVQASTPSKSEAPPPAQPQARTSVGQGGRKGRRKRGRHHHAAQPAPAPQQTPAPPPASAARTPQAPARPTRTVILDEPDLEPAHAGPAGASERFAATVYAAVSPRKPAPRRAPARRPGGISRALIGVLGVVALLAVVMRYSTRTHLGDASQPTSSVRTAAPATDAPGKAQEIVVAPEPHTTAPAPAPEPAGDEHAKGPELEVPPAGEPAHSADEPAARAVEPAKHLTAAVEPPKREAPAGKYGLEVASFIFEERARQERDRLRSAGLKARVVTTLEFGSRVYRVVIGGYPHPAAAERAADSLLSNGVVLQARVVQGRH